MKVLFLFSKEHIELISKWVDVSGLEPDIAPSERTGLPVSLHAHLLVSWSHLNF